MNPVAQTLCGWTQSEAVGQPVDPVFRIVNETTRQPADNPVGRVIAEGVILGLANHTILISRDGTESPIDDSAAPIIDKTGRVCGVILVFRDITEKRRAEVANERLAAIVESSDDIIASKTLDGVITSWNRGAERVLGYTADEVIGRHVSMLMPPELIEDMPRILDRVRRGERVDHYRTRRRRKDGTIVDVALTVSPIRDGDGEIIGASKIGRDITHEKRIEAERQEADRRKDEFLAMLAHELRNPLSAIHGAAQLFGRLETEEELEWARDVVLRQVKHLGRLIDDLLDASRISRGKIALRKEIIRLSPVVSSAVEAVHSLMAERKHDLSVSLAGDGLSLEADPLRLEQVLVNLLMNAAKYTDAGGRISLTATQEGADVVIKVRDNGMGIAPKLLPHIFDIFVQGDRTAARSEGGLGIGLTLVHKLVEMHGGSVTAESDGPGKGSEFTVRLPALRPAEIREPRPQPASQQGIRRASRILIVNDNRDSAGGLSRTAEAARARRPSRVRRHVRHRRGAGHAPDCVLLDIGMPGMDGYDVVKLLRSDECCKDSLFIAVTGYGQPEDIRRSKEAGFDHHLVKPVDYQVLMSLFASPAS